MDGSRRFTMDPLRWYCQNEEIAGLENENPSSARSAEKAEADINTMIVKLYNECNMYLEQIHQIDNDLAFTDELVRVREKAFEEELASGTEVTDARLLQAKTRIERLQAMYGFDTTLARLFQFAGIPEQFTSWQLSDKAKTGSL